MEVQPEQWPEGVFEIEWHQQNPDDWVAIVRDTSTGQCGQVRTLEELAQFVQSHLGKGRPQPVES